MGLFLRFLLHGVWGLRVVIRCIQFQKLLEVNTRMDLDLGGFRFSEVEGCLAFSLLNVGFRLPQLHDFRLNLLGLFLDVRGVFRVNFGTLLSIAVQCPTDLLRKRPR